MFARIWIIIISNCKPDGETAMKAAEFQVVKDVQRAAKGQLRFFNSMMEAKTASSSAKATPAPTVTKDASSNNKQK